MIHNRLFNQNLGLFRDLKPLENKNENKTAEEKQDSLKEEQQSPQEESMIEDLPTLKGDDVVAMNNRFILDLGKLNLPVNSATDEMSKNVANKKTEEAVNNIQTNLSDTVKNDTINDILKDSNIFSMVNKGSIKELLNKNINNSTQQSATDRHTDRPGVYYRLQAFGSHR